MSARRTERLLNLVFALMATGRPVGRAEIRAAVPGYAESPSDEAFERMFERDKDELRGMGVPVETVTNARGEVDGYRIRRDDYELPEVGFTPAELSVLGLAARVWEQAALGPAATSALRKLEAAVPDAVGDPGGVGIATRVSSADAALLPLLAAVRERRAVRFAYRRPDQPEPAPRRLQPWGLVSWRGRWYVAGRDLDRGEPRVFRLSRIAGPVTATGVPGGYEIPPDVDVRAMVRGSVGDPPRGAARVRVRAGAAHRLRRRATVVDSGPEADVLEVPYRDEEALAAELAGLGTSVVVLEPTEVRDAVLRRLRGVLATGERT